MCCTWSIHEFYYRFFGTLSLRSVRLGCFKMICWIRYSCAKKERSRVDFPLQLRRQQRCDRVNVVFVDDSDDAGDQLGDAGQPRRSGGLVQSTQSDVRDRWDRPKLLERRQQQSWQRQVDGRQSRPWNAGRGPQPHQEATGRPPSAGQFLSCLLRFGKILRWSYQLRVMASTQDHWNRQAFSYELKLSELTHLSKLCSKIYRTLSYQRSIYG